MADEIIKVDPISERAFDEFGKEWTDAIYVYCRRRAHQNNKYLKHQIRTTDGKSQFRQVFPEDVDEFSIDGFLDGSFYTENLENETNLEEVEAEAEKEPEVSNKPKLPRKSTKELLAEIKPVEVSLNTEDEIVEFIKNSPSFKPEFLKMSDTKWKLLVRSSIRGKNIMMTGSSGEGKTVSVYCLSAALGREFFYINMGNTQDAQTSLIGKTHFDSSKGTFFNESYFVKAIKTPNAIILLDELSRMSDDASNILMSVLDENQRYLRLTEDVKSEKIEVAEGVTFVATANIGNEYTTTSVLDRAILSRFVIVEIDTLNKTDKIKLLSEMYPSVNIKIIKDMVNLSEDIRNDYESDAAQVNTLFSTRECIEIVGLIDDGFSFSEAITQGLLPLFDKDGGTESPRTFVMQAAQKYDN